MMGQYIWIPAFPEDINVMGLSVDASKKKNVNDTPCFHNVVRVWAEKAYIP